MLVRVGSRRHVAEEVLDALPRAERDREHQTTPIPPAPTADDSRDRYGRAFELPKIAERVHRGGLFDDAKAD